MILFFLVIEMIVVLFVVGIGEFGSIFCFNNKLINVDFFVEK